MGSRVLNRKCPPLMIVNNVIRRESRLYCHYLTITFTVHMETGNLPMISLQKFKILYLDFNSRVNNKKYFGAFQLNSVSVIHTLNTRAKTERENLNFLIPHLAKKKIFQNISIHIGTYSARNEPTLHVIFYV